jgi:hypothetical protein
LTPILVTGAVRPLTMPEVLMFLLCLYGSETKAECSPMLLQRFLVWIKMRHRGATQSQDDPGFVISTRLKELLQAKNPESIETTSTVSPNEDDQNQLNRDKFGT